MLRCLPYSGPWRVFRVPVAGCGGFLATAWLWVLGGVGCLWHILLAGFVFAVLPGLRCRIWVTELCYVTRPSERRRGVHGPTRGNRVKGIAMMTGEFSRPHSVRYGAITQLGPARNWVPVHINITMWRGVR